MADDNGDGGILDLVKRVQVWIATLVGLVTAVSTAYLLIKQEPQVGVLLISGVGVLVLWLMLLQFYRAKKRTSTHDPSKKRYKHGKRQRALALFGLIALPTIEGVALIVIMGPPRPPRDRLVVAVAAFAPVGGVVNEADSFTYSLRLKLNSKKDDENIPLEPKPLDRIEGSFSQTEEQTALKLGRSKGAHIVLWGSGRKSRERATNRLLG